MNRSAPITSSALALAAAATRRLRHELGQGAIDDAGARWARLRRRSGRRREAHAHLHRQPRPRACAPRRPCPRAGRMPRGSFMAAIQRRGYLRAGVNAGALDFGYSEPRDRKDRGVRDRPRAPARPRHLRRLESERIPAGGAHASRSGSRPCRTGRSTSSSTPSRSPASASKQVDFSTVYYEAQPAPPGAVQLARHRHHRVQPTSGCAPARGRRRST